MSTYQIFNQNTYNALPNLAAKAEYLLTCQISAKEAVNFKSVEFEPCLQAFVGELPLPIYCHGNENQTIQQAVYWLKTHALSQPKPQQQAKGV